MIAFVLGVPLVAMETVATIYGTPEWDHLICLWNYAGYDIEFNAEIAEQTTIGFSPFDLTSSTAFCMFCQFDKLDTLVPPNFRTTWFFIEKSC